MKVDITGRHIEITPALREHAEEKLGKLDKILEGPNEAHVVLFIEKHRHVAEIQLKNRSGVFSGQEETDDLYVSIDSVVDKLESQVRKFKDKRTARRRRDGVKASEAAAVLESAVAEAPSSDDGDDDAATRRIVRSDQYRVKPLTPEDAAIELESSGRDLLVFRDAETERINVLHRLQDGNYGLVDPDE
jgi:putative sigma-54 modulation protein